MLNLKSGARGQILDDWNKTKLNSIIKIKKIAAIINLKTEAKIKIEVKIKTKRRINNSSIIGKEKRFRKNFIGSKIIIIWIGDRKIKKSERRHNFW